MAPTFTSISSAEPANPLAGKLILLGVGGGIAAYKSCELARLLVRAGADVHVLMTKSAMEFVQPITFAALTQNPVGTTLFDAESPTAMTHTELGMKADAFVVAPATANLVGSMAHGLATDLLTTTLLVATCPTLVCPAMNTNMWENPQVQANIAQISTRSNFQVMPPDSGELACGVVGAGRLPEPEGILKALRVFLGAADKSELQGRSVLISGGPTREYLDPVRFLSNPASGSLAIHMASDALSRGAEVTLVLGPTELQPPPGVHCVRVTSAEEMAQAVLDAAPSSDLLCMTAAVADWRPEVAHDAKQHKEGAEQTLKLVRTTDILQSVRELPGSGPRVLGFAAETEENLHKLETLGREKMHRKGCDLLFVNPVFGERYGFGAGDTKGVLLGPGEKSTPVSSLSKQALASTLIRAAAALFDAPSGDEEEQV